MPLAFWAAVWHYDVLAMDPELQVKMNVTAQPGK